MDESAYKTANQEEPCGEGGQPQAPPTTSDTRVCKNPRCGHFNLQIIPRVAGTKLLCPACGAMVGAIQRAERTNASLAELRRELTDYYRPRSTTARRDVKHLAAIYDRLETMTIGSTAHVRTLTSLHDLIERLEAQRTTPLDLDADLSNMSLEDLYARLRFLRDEIQAIRNRTDEPKETK